MERHGQNLFLTGAPGCGKTTVIRRVVSSLALSATGFYTEEIRGTDGRRRGFAVVTLDGQRGGLSDVSIKGPHRVGRYGVDLECVDRLVVPSLDPAHNNQLIVVDEVGKMECLSQLFCDRVREVLDGPNPILGTVALGGAPFIREIRGRGDVQLVEVTGENRDRLVGELVKILNPETKKEDEAEP